MHVLTRQGLPTRPATLLIFVSCLLLAPAARAQNPGGTIEGTVQDAEGERVPSAGVAIRQLQAQTTHKITTDTRGEFRLDNLPPGPYRVMVEAPGFAAASSDVAVEVSTVRDVTVTLQPAPVRQAVNVEGEASSMTTQPLDTTSAVVGGVVTARDLATIPLANRSFANISYLVPGTEPVEPSDPTKARITAVSFGGSSGLNDQLSVDGGDNSDDYIGGFLQNFSPDDIQEFAVRTAQEDADTGRMTAGSVVITTKRGGNDYHGDLGFYERAAALNARFPIENPAPNPKQPFSRQNYIGTLGGPIRKDKLWFFSSIEAVHEKASIAYSPASQTEFNALAGLAAQGLIPGVTSIPVPGSVPIPFREYLGSERLDWSQSERSQWFARASIDNYTTNNDLIQQATLPSTGATSGSKYENLVMGNQFTFSPTWLGAFTFNASALHHTETRNSDLGFALAFPFSSTYRTISGFETFGDNQFVTPITAFPILRNQEKYQFRYDVSNAHGGNAPRFGIDFIHEPVLSGALSGAAESLTTFPLDPTYYVANPAQFRADLGCAPNATPGATCTNTPAGNGSFSQNVQRLGLYAENSWRETPHLTIDYGLRYDTTFGLFTASGRPQLDNPAFSTLRALQIPLIPGAPHDYRGALAPRIGIAYGLNSGFKTVIRAGFGLFYNDLAQNGWVTALQAVNEPPGVCAHPGDAGCIPGVTAGGAGAIIDPGYKTPYAIHATAGVEHAFNPDWTLTADYTHEQGVHAFARYQYQAGYTLFSPLFPASDITAQMSNLPDITDFRADNRSRYDALSLHLQGNVTGRANLIVNYTLSKAKTWGCVLGELFDYVDGVCNPLHAFGPGDFGPSGEDVTDRFVAAGIFHAPGGLELSLLGQAETARPITLTTPLDVNGLGDALDDRAVINGAQTALDQFRGTPYVQFDMRVARPTRINERWTLMPFVEFFNLFNRNNPGANYVTDISALPNINPTPGQLANLTELCANAACTSMTPITSFRQVLVPAGALGDFFGPGTTVGVPFAAQIGVRATF
ncbi:MAG TPA: carboxypeptidase regulatory-like domain-containing protein [Terriglobia bacterium]|nr:carboxypeptidase regulatory-like domain-containing protein [Terriglobia bacterium]